MREHTWVIVVDGVEVTVTAKPVRHLRLVVHPDGRVRASVPLSTSRRAAAQFVNERIGWVQTQRARQLARASTPLPLGDGATVRVWGDDVVMHVVQGRPGGRLTPNGFVIGVADPAAVETQALTASIQALYRRELRAVLPDVVAKWAGALGRGPSRVVVRSMSTRWGSCTAVTGAIRVNPELAARHPRCLNYVVLHELVHLTEPGHGPRFQAAMDAHLPEWRQVRAELNRPVRPA